MGEPMMFTIAGNSHLPKGPPELVESAIRAACEGLARTLSNELLGHWQEDEEGPYQTKPGLIEGSSVSGRELRFSVVVSFSEVE
jgi:hypothetical protein